MNTTKKFSPYLEVMMLHVEVRVGTGEFQFGHLRVHYELDLPGIGLELIADVKADAAHHDVNEVLQLEQKRKVCHVNMIHLGQVFKCFN